MGSWRAGSCSGIWALWPSAIETCVSRAGICIEVHHGRLCRWARGGSAVEGRWMAAVLACGPGACAEPSLGRALWGLVPRRRSNRNVTSPAGPLAGEAESSAMQSALPDDEWLVVDGIPVTSPSRTFFDLGGGAGDAGVGAGFERGGSAGADRPALGADLLERYPGRRGSRGRCGRCSESKSRSGVHRGTTSRRRSWRSLMRYGLPRPRLNARPLRCAGASSRSTASGSTQRLVVELDSRGVHGTPERFERDRSATGSCSPRDGGSMRVTWRQLRDGHPPMRDLRRTAARLGGLLPLVDGSGALRALSER